MARPPAPGSAALIEPFWLAYQRECKVQVPGFSAAALGNTAAVADELAALIESGVKRAHATLRREFEQSLQALPQIGEHLVVLDGEGTPRAIVRTTRVERRHFNEIDDEFAFDAGEGDLTLRWWLVAHRQDYAERAEREGFEVDERTELVLEWFECVWPQRVKDNPAVPPELAAASPHRSPPD